MPLGKSKKKKKIGKKIIICLIYPKKPPETQNPTKRNSWTPDCFRLKKELEDLGTKTGSPSRSPVLSSYRPVATPDLSDRSERWHGRMQGATRGPSMRSRVPWTSAFPSSSCPFFLPSWFRFAVCDHFLPCPLPLLVQGTEPPT